MPPNEIHTMPATHPTGVFGGVYPDSYTEVAPRKINVMPVQKKTMFIILYTVATCMWLNKNNYLYEKMLTEDGQCLVNAYSCL